LDQPSLEPFKEQCRHPVSGGQSRQDHNAEQHRPKRRQPAGQQRNAPDHRQADHAEPGQLVAHFGKAAKARSYPSQRTQAYRADHEADHNQDQAREAVTDPAQIQAYDNDPADRTEDDDPRDKTPDPRCLAISGTQRKPGRLTANGSDRITISSQAATDVLMIRLATL
jgi:hypothetical protein